MVQAFTWCCDILDDIVNRIVDWVSALSPNAKAATALITVVATTWGFSTAYMSSRFASSETVENLTVEVDALKQAMVDLAAYSRANAEALDSLSHSIQSLDQTACFILMEIRDIAAGEQQRIDWQKCALPIGLIDFFRE